jgi:hypothetical protein
MLFQFGSAPPREFLTLEFTKMDTTIPYCRVKLADIEFNSWLTENEKDELLFQ